MTEPSAEAREQAEYVLGPWAEREVESSPASRAELVENVARALAENARALAEAHTQIDGADRVAVQALRQRDDARTRLAEVERERVTWDDYKRDMEKVKQEAWLDRQRLYDHTAALEVDFAVMRGRIEAALSALRADPGEFATSGLNTCYEELGAALASSPGAAVKGAVVMDIRERYAERKEAVPTSEALSSQVDRLARFIVENIPGEPSHSEGAIDTAIRLLGQHTAELAAVRVMLERTQKAARHWHDQANIVLGFTEDVVSNDADPCAAWRATAREMTEALADVVAKHEGNPTRSPDPIGHSQALLARPEVQEMRGR